MSASRAEIGSLGGSGTHGGVCGLATEGRRPVNLEKKAADRPAPCKIGSMQHIDLVTQVDGR
jgi:hypothetical protein